MALEQDWFGRGRMGCVYRVGNHMKGQQGISHMAL